MCRVETGMKCAGGSPNSPDLCFEVCGDGRNAGYFACDDGNLVDGDGCSAKCESEPGFQCTGGSPYNRDLCHEICGDGID